MRAGILGAITPTVRVSSVVAADETEVVAVVAAGPRLAEATLRCWDEGWAVLPINPAFTATETSTLLERLRPTRLVGLDSPHDSGADIAAASTYPDGVPVPADTAAIVVTSGTEGTPKGVELTRPGMEAMGRAYSAGLDAGPTDRWLACLPLHHVASLGALARSYVTGVPCTVHDGFDLERVARSPRDEGTTIVSLVPTAMRRLLDAGAPLHEFRRVISGGAPCPPALRARAEDQGVAVVDAYGLSETWGGFALDGLPIAGAEVELADSGEILVRGPMVMRAYRLDPIRSADVIDADGWFHTGDVGAVDAGRYRVIDRLKDLVITGGVNISPTEVEGVLAHHPEVDDVCVVGVPDDEWGELVVAFVVPRPGSRAPSIEELRAFGRDRLSAPKLPRAMLAVDAIPRTASGKPLRRLLRETTAMGDAVGT
jgi:o-succinylbenzoate---CoA ligase